MSEDLDASDLHPLEQAVNSATGRVSALWLSFISFAAYLIIATGSITHRNLLLETPVKMPILNVDLPLIGFFVVAPILLVLFHFYVLLHMHELTGKFAEYGALLRQQAPMAVDRRLLGLRLDNRVFLQLLSALPEPQEGLVTFLIRTIASVTVVGLPLFLLLEMQFTYLPYQNEPAIWFLRIVIIVESLLVWKLWRSIRQIGASQPRAFGATAILAILAVCMSVGVAIFPGETIYDYVPKPLTRLLFEGPIDQLSGRAGSPFANRLAVPDQNLIDVDKVGKLSTTVSLRGRNLRGAVLSRSDLRGADFTGAHLVDATLVGTNLAHANFGCADELKTTGCADLRSADLAKANLESSRFGSANLEGASLEGANLAGASLANAVLTAGDLRGAILKDATVSPISAYGASFDGSHLDGAVVELLDLEGTSAIQVGGVTVPDESPNIWTATKDDSPLDSEARKSLAEDLGNLMCTSAEPHVSHGLIRNNRLTHTGTYIQEIGKKIKSTECRGAKKLSAEDWGYFKQQEGRPADAK
jgi:uncharacterized protein YjbI with pentapeptide repeats